VLEAIRSAAGEAPLWHPPVPGRRFGM
jgi:hypothetical protein